MGQGKRGREALGERESVEVRGKDKVAKDRERERKGGEREREREFERPSEVGG